MLLTAERFVTRERIRSTIDGYQGLSDDAFKRMFERDKDELRAKGVPIEMISYSALFDDYGYRIRRENMELPPIEFSQEEAAMVSLAKQVWQENVGIDATKTALLKLRAGGAQLVDSPSAPSINISSPDCHLLLEAVANRRKLQFKYRSSPDLRIVQPWKTRMRGGNLYLLGFDETRNDSRLFRLDRMRDLKAETKTDAFEVPDIDLDELTQRLSPPPADQIITVAVRKNCAPDLTRTATAVKWENDLPPDYQSWQVKLPSVGVVAQLASYGDKVVVLAPETIRNQVVEHLSQVGR